MRVNDFMLNSDSSFPPEYLTKSKLALWQKGLILRAQRMTGVKPKKPMQTYLGSTKLSNVYCIRDHPFMTSTARGRGLLEMRT